MDRKDNKIIDLYLSGNSYAQIRSKLGVSTNTVFNVLSRNNIPKRNKLSELRRACKEGRTGSQKPKNHDINNIDILIDMNHNKKMNLIDIAKHYGVGKKTISRRFKQAGAEVKINREKSIKATLSRIKQVKELNDPKWLKWNYLEYKRTIGNIAKEFNVSNTYVRNRLIKNDIKIRKSNPLKSRSSFGRGSYYDSIKHKKIYLRSFYELQYAVYLDNDPNVISWSYETKPIVYYDGFTGNQKKYFVDFIIDRIDKTEHVEVKAPSQRIVKDKYLYAQHILPNWRFINDKEFEEMANSWKFANPNRIRFINRPGNKETYNFYFPSDDNIGLEWSVVDIKERGCVIIKKCTRNPNSIVKPKKKNSIYKNKKFEPSDSDFKSILEMIKSNKTLKEIAEKFNIKTDTMNKMLRRRSYYIVWRQWRNTKSDNRIYKAGKLIWPESVS